MTELSRKRGDERGEGERRTNGNDRESEKRERMPLFVNQSAVSERENSENPQREEEDRGEVGRDGGGGFNRGGGYLQLLQRIA